MTGLTEERIGSVVQAHDLTPEEADVATAFALDVIKIMLERHLSCTETACALKLLAHLRNDLCSSSGGKNDRQ
jgi:hypothetical protein